MLKQLFNNPIGTWELWQQDQKTASQKHRNFICAHCEKKITKGHKYSLSFDKNIKGLLHFLLCDECIGLLFFGKNFLYCAIAFSDDSGDDNVRIITE